MIENSQVQCAGRIAEQRFVQALLWPGRVLVAIRQIWLFLLFALAPALATAGCYQDGGEWFCAAPDISIRSPSAGQSFSTSTPISVIVDASDYAPVDAPHTSLIYEIRLYVNGTLSRYQRYTPTNVAEATAQFDLGALTAGSYTLKAVVMDQQGRERSKQIQITSAGPVLSATQTTTTASPNPAQVGLPVTVGAQVTGGTTPTGTVTIREDGKAGTAVTLTGGQGSLAMAFADPGWYYVSSTYGGDSSHQGSTSSSLTIVVQKRQTSVSLNSSSASVLTNQTFTLSASVSGASPGGTVTFKAGGTTLQTVAVSNGSAALTTSLSSVGTYAITAEYGGDSNNAASTSGAVSVGVKAPASVALSSSPASPAVSGSVTYTAAVTGASPSGTVQFYDNGAALGGAVTISSGSAAVTTSYVSSGSHAITASYAGDGNNTSASSATLNVTVSARSTSTSLATSTTTPGLNQSMTLSASVSGTNPTGSVTFLADGVALGSAIALSGGSASTSVAFSTAGGRSITARYDGDGNNTGSTSGAVAITVQKGASSIGLTASTTAALVNQSVTFNATVSGSNVGGTVTFLVGGSALQTVSLSSGVASLTTSFASAGSYSVTATYNGDSNNATSTSSAIGVGVKASAAVGLASSPASPAVSESVTYTATVTGASPTGTVQFTDSGSALGAPVTLSGGAASVTTSYTTAGGHSISASYVGDGNNTAATSSALSVTVVPRATSTSVAAGTAAPGLNQSVTLSASVSGTNPTGTVQFLADGAALGSAVSLSSGNASTSATFGTAGARTITARYNGDSNNAGSTSGGTVVTVQKGASSTGLSVGTTALLVNQSTTLSATVTGSSAGGSVTFRSNGAALQTVALSNGTASLSTSFASAGSYAITADYSGDANNNTSTSPSVAVGVKASATVGLASTPASPTVSQSVTYTATVTGASPTGTVRFTENGSALGASVSVASGSASITASYSTAGARSIGATYSGDANNTTATATALGVTVGKRSSSAAVAVTNATPRVGENTTLTATVSGTNPTGTVTFLADGATLGGAVSLSNGTASLSASFASAGARSLTVSYGGDANHTASTSSAQSVRVQKQSASIALSAATSSIKVGQSVRLTATLTGAGGVVPTGTVSFLSDGSAIATAVTVVNGSAVFDASFATVGSRSLTVSYAGDGNSSAITSSAVAVTVVKRDSSVALASSASSTQPGKSFTLTATVAGTSPTGTVTFYDGSQAIGSAVSLNNGVASKAVSLAAVGTRSLTARYGGDGNHDGSTSAGVAVVVDVQTVQVTVPHLNNPIAGSLPGSVQVNGGKASYSVPLAMPPGVLTMTPTVSLDYSGGAGNGIAGVGWSISGQSMIQRCPPTLAQDGRGDAVRLNNKDRLCLDGKRLELVGPDTTSVQSVDEFNTRYWATNAVYRAEIDSFVRVQRSGTGFTVYAKDGRIHTYVSTDALNPTAPASAVVRMWPLSKTQDRNGNTIEYQYTRDIQTGEQLLSQVLWGGNSNVPQNHFAKAVFTYEARPDAETLFFAGARADIRQRLKTVTTWTNTTSSTPVQALQYTLSYGISPSSGRSMLTSVQACSPVDGCLPATTFTWGEPDPSKSRAFVSRGTWNGPVLEDQFRPNTSATAGHAQDEMFVSGDFDGDGRSDVMTRFGGAGITLYRSTGTGFVTSQPFAGLDAQMAIVEVGDFDGDGQTDVLIARGALDMYGVVQVTNQVLTDWKICYSRLRQGGTFSCVDWGVDGVNAIQRVVYDFNADGRDDIYFSGGSPGDGNMGTQRSCISTGTGFTCQVQVNGAGIYLGPGQGGSFTQFSPLATADLDGDGRLDFITAGQAVYNAEGNFWTFTEPYIAGRGYSAEAGGAVSSSYIQLHDYGVPSQYSVNTPPDYRASATGLAGDINGDGLTDFFFMYGPTPSVRLVRRLCLMTGDGSELCENRTDARTEERQSPDWYVGNIEGDGVPRALMARPKANFNYPPVACLIRFGASMDCKQWTIPPLPDGLSPNPPFDWQQSRIFFLDLTGDGHPEVVYYRAGGRWEVLEHVRLAKDGEALDRLVQVTNGLGLPSRITYSAHGDANVYTRDAADPDGNQTATAYPQKPVPLIDQVVSSIKVGNGQGGWLETRFRYAGARSDQSGRGFLGYGRMESLDVASGVTTTTWFSQAWPTIGMTTATRQTSASGVVLVDSRSTLDTQTIAHPNGRTTRFPFTSTQAVSKNDLSGDLLGTFTTAWVYGDGWGNPTQVTETASADGETFLSTSTTTYENRSTDWLLGLPARVAVTKTRAGVSVTRTSSAEFDAKGQQSKQTVEPDAPAYRVVTESFRTGNVYGLVSSTRQSWTDPQTGQTVQRTSNATQLDSNGRFILKSTNPLGHEEAKQYDPRHGKVTQATSPNGIVTNWTVDGFGRVTNELRADGTETRQAIVQCDADCPPGAVQAMVVDQYQGNQRYGVPSITYADSAGQVLRKRTNGLQGQVVVADLRYDARGRLVEADQPHDVDAPAVLATRTGYDDLNRTTSVTSLDEAGVERSQTTEYWGLRVKTTNANNYSIENYRDALGLLRRTIDANGKETRFEREPFGGLTKTRDPVGNEVVVTLDRLGRRTQMSDPDLGLTKYEMDPHGRVWKQTSAKNQVFTIEFDLLDRVIARHEPDLESRWVYDTAAKGIGQLVEAYTLQGQQKDYWRQHSFDALARPDVTTTTLNGVVQATKTTYDDKGRVATLAHQRGSDAAKTFNYRYSATGYLVGIDRGAMSLWSVQQQDAAGRVRQVALGNGLNQLTTYDPNSGLVTAVSLERSAGNAALVEGYQYDALANVTQRTQWWEGSGFVEAFQYDSLQRLKSAQVFGQPQQVFEYDDIGNLRFKTGVGTYTYPAAGQPRPHAVIAVTSQSGSYAYDDNGNLVSGPNSTSLDWASFDVPSRIGRGGAWSQFAFSPDHQRSRQTRNDGTTILYMGAMEQETNSSGGVTLKTYWPMGLGVEIDRPGSQSSDLLWMHADRLGSVIALSQSDGQFREKLAYDAWGKRRTLDGSSTPDTLDGQSDNRGFTGHEMLDNVEMIHMNGRVYDPYLARFVSPDPIIQAPEHSQSYNRYTYVWNNPTNLTDPTGFEAKKDDKLVVVLPSPKQIVDALCKEGDSACKEKAEQDMRSLLGLENGADLPSEGNLVLTYASQSKEQSAGPEMSDRAKSAARFRKNADDFVEMAETFKKNHPIIDAFTNQSSHYLEAAADARFLADMEERKLSSESKSYIFRAALLAIVKPNGKVRLPVFKVSARKNPQLAENISHAQNAGHPKVLTHGGDAPANRAAAVGEVPRIQSRDEYPFASSKEGGAGSWVGHIPGRQNSSQGGLLMNFLKKNGIKEGDQYRVEVVK